jgi:hypothetical protein
MFSKHTSILACTLTAVTHAASRGYPWGVYRDEAWIECTTGNFTFHPGEDGLMELILSREIKRYHVNADGLKYRQFRVTAKNDELSGQDKIAAVTRTIRQILHWDTVSKMVEYDVKLETVFESHYRLWNLNHSSDDVENGINWHVLAQMCTDRIRLSTAEYALADRLSTKQYYTEKGDAKYLATHDVKSIKFWYPYTASSVTDLLAGDDDFNEIQEHPECGIKQCYKEFDPTGAFKDTALAQVPRRRLKSVSSTKAGKGPLASLQKIMRM